MMHHVSQPGLTAPAVVGRLSSEGLGSTEDAGKPLSAPGGSLDQRRRSEVVAGLPMPAVVMLPPLVPPSEANAAYRPKN
jgi:hypothetical protein